MSNECALCHKSATEACSACCQVVYCCKEHQKEDWKRHKKTCTPYKIQKDEILGRHVIATRNIKPGEVIMKSPPLILAPKTVSAPLCLVCHKRLNLEASRYDCSKCGWPLCNEMCEILHLREKECEIFAEACYKPGIKNESTKQSVYSSIAPLRALLLKLKDKEKFDLLLTCQSHLEKHLSTPVYQILKRNLVPFFTNILTIDTNETEILKICSIFDTNCFEVRDTEGLVNIRGLYPTIALLSHDCKHNTKHSFDGDDFNLILTATRPIKKGDLITTTYTQTLWGTLERRAHLKMSKNFECVCERCMDPTEYGIYVGSVNCIHCGNERVVSSDPLNRSADWSCEKCGFLIAGEEVIYRNELLKKEIAMLDKRSPRNLEEFLVKNEQVVHGKNSFCLQVKYALCQMYGNYEGFKFDELPDELIDRKVQLCQELLEVADILEPGYSRFRGWILFELYQALEVKTKREEKNVSEEVKLYLEEAEKILRLEPDLAKVVQQKMKSLQI